MTTKVTITCQENSHWDIAVITVDQVYDQDTREPSGVWKHGPEIILGPGETAQNLYVHSSRRYIVEERDRPKV